MGDICVYVVNHKESNPIEEDGYKLLRVGAPCDYESSSEAVACDSTGESISYKNFAYCELTGLYWIWKNTSHDITGLMHYRRFLASPTTGKALSSKEIEEELLDHEILVPRPVALNCSVAEQYCFSHISTDLLALMDVMESQPEKYRMAFSSAMSSEMIIPCNIMIAKKETLDGYCSWLFSVLGEMEERIDLFSGRDEYQMRAFGFLSERLLLVWLIANDVDCGFHDLLIFDSAEELQVGFSNWHYLDLMSGLHGISKSQVFERDFYLSLYPDVAAAFPPDKAIEHYLECGIPEGRYPSSAYLLDDYANLRPKLRSKVGKMSQEIFFALERETRLRKPIISRHLILGTTRSGITDYSPVYDWLYYTNRYQDVPDDPFRTEDALRHFIEIGIPEGRQGSKGFALEAYKNSHPELVRKFGDDNRRYYLNYIRKEFNQNHPIQWHYTE